ncbi:MAG: hypothetical protein IJE61_06390 [Bacteroidales bacterium]|nr:hypothetical protein [Bacteroidales bacterium]
MSSIRRCALYILAAVALVVAACEKDTGGGSSKDEWKSPYDLTGLTVDGGFPIVAWTGITASDSDTWLKEMKGCGINVYLGWYDTIEEVMTVLDNSEAAGTKAILNCDELFSNTGDVVARMKDHPALFAYHIADEPSVSDFPMLKEAVNKILSFDDSHPCYINLYPNWAWGGIDDYLQKVNAFLTTVPQRFVSFDHYPIREIDGESSVRPEWYKNLEDIRRVARAKKLPIWAFALSLAHYLEDVTYPVPTLEELRVQQFSNLVYGAQGFQYFTFHGIYKNSPTQVYDKVKNVNASLQALSKIFLGAEIADVWHTGATIPYGTKALAALPDGISSLKTSDGGAVVSKVIKDGNTYIAIVNKDYKKDMILEIAFSRKVTKIDNMGYKAQAGSETVTVSPGNIIIYQIH